MTSRDLQTKVLWSTITFVQSQLAFFLGNADFPSCPQVSLVHLCWIHSTVSHRSMQFTISNKSGNYANQYPAYDYWKYCLVLKPWVSQREICELLECPNMPSKSPRQCSWEHQSHPGATWTSIEDDHITRIPCHSPYHEAKGFSLSTQG